jgi:L-alanine-DL-glutamate epimerase-like enolase superfamily enzyme
VKITSIRLDRLRLPLDPPFAAAWDPQPRRHFDTTIVTVETDEGLTGIGSGDTMDGFDAFEELFLGTDPRQIARHVRALETLAFHAGRYWPLEVALWDLLGKAAGLPVATLFGGTLDRIPAYASTGELKPAPERVESALAARELGFTAMKVRIEPSRLDEGIDTVAATREALGDEFVIMVDLNQSWRMPGDVSKALDYATVRRTVDRLAELDVFWVEEPLPYTDGAGLATLRECTTTRIAAGEMLRTPADVLALIEVDALDVYQMDVVLAGGMSRCRMLAELALQKHRDFTPHTWTNGIGLLANLHVAAGVGGGPYLEFPFDPPGWTPERRDFPLSRPVRIEPDGCIAVPDAPGLGFELDADTIERYRRR